MNRYEIKTLFHKDKNYSKIKELLKGNSDAWSFNILAKIAIYEKELDKAKIYFDLANNIVGKGYCLFLENKISEARSCLSIVCYSSSVSIWLYILCNFLEDNYIERPSYFQIRNYFEQDLEMLFFYQNNVLAEKMINNCKYFQEINGEVFKYCGRVLLHNSNIELAEKYIKKSLDVHYYDVETHYLLGEIYEKLNCVEKALEFYKKTIDINPMYYPALTKIKLLSN